MVPVITTRLSLPSGLASTKRGGLRIGLAHYNTAAEVRSDRAIVEACCCKRALEFLVRMRGARRPRNIENEKG